MQTKQCYNMRALLYPYQRLKMWQTSKTRYLNRQYKTLPTTYCYFYMQAKQCYNMCALLYPYQRLKN